MFCLSIMDEASGTIGHCAGNEQLACHLIEGRNPIRVFSGPNTQQRHIVTFSYLK